MTEQHKPEQEPVAWMQPDEVHISLWEDDYHTIPLYTTPPQRKPLTEEQIIEATEHIDTNRSGYFVHITRAIEAAHGIKE